MNNIYLERDEDADERENQWLNLYGDSDDYDEWDSERFAPCSCPYCFCAMDVEGGGVCGDCSMGAHQG